MPNTIVASAMCCCCCCCFSALIQLYIIFAMVYRWCAIWDLKSQVQSPVCSFIRSLAFIRFNFALAYKHTHTQAKILYGIQFYMCTLHRHTDTHNSLESLRIRKKHTQNNSGLGSDKIVWHSHWLGFYAIVMVICHLIQLI